MVSLTVKRPFFSALPLTFSQKTQKMISALCVKVAFYCSQKKTNIDLNHKLNIEYFRKKKVEIA